jgi:putative Mg2+ transporter-C (MgtC) family protein
MAIDVAADWTYAVRLIVAAALGALIGLEREIHDHPAGMRTHLLVSVGSAGFTVLSIAAFPAPGADPARIAAQIVTGIGFLGAGAILKEGATVRGLTTAASLWATAAVGMAAGAGAWITAATITAIVIVSLWPLRLVANRVIGRDPHIVRMRLLVDDATALSDVVAVITKSGGSVSHLATTIRQGSRLAAEVEVRARDLATGAALTAAVAETTGIEIAESSSQGE